jgi:vesicle-associated membrane protein 7
LHRGERLDDLVDRTDDFNQAAFAFRKRTTALKRALWWKNARLMMMIVWVLVVLVYFFVSTICGFPGNDFISILFYNHNNIYIAWDKCFS